jgi:hypothetical protein
MRNIYTIILLAAIFAGGCKSPQTTTATADTLIGEDTSVKLFDGKTTKGWHSYGKAEASSAWKAEDGVLHLDASNKNDWQTKNGGDLVTDEEYENFEFSVEWKIAKGGNSGIIFFIKEDPKKYPYTWHTGIETQICDNKRNEDGQILKHRAGDLYDLMAINKDVVKPGNEWNKTVIIANNGVLNIFVNDEQVLTTKLWNESWDKLVSESKFREWPDFGTFKKGKIALQDHGADVWFRDIKIRKL